MNRYLICVLLLSIWGCVTYRKCEQKFGTVHIDTTYVEKPVTVLVPKDSVVLSLKTDTTTVYKEIQQGRAKIIYSRTHEKTIVQADCDSVVVTKTIRVPVESKHITWGVNPFWKTIAYAFITLFLGSWLAWCVRYFMVNYEIDIQRKLIADRQNDGDTNKQSI